MRGWRIWKKKVGVQTVDRSPLSSLSLEEMRLKMGLRRGPVRDSDSSIPINSNVGNFNSNGNTREEER